MKKLLASLISFAISATYVLGGFISNLTISAAKSQTYGDLTYMNYGGWIEITDCSTTVETVEIPEKINNTTVRDIGDNAFSGCSALTKITIPDTVKTIGMNAFNGCSSLKIINLPVKLQKIGFNAFYSCTGLSSIEIPDSVTTIDGFAFNNCSGLKTITIPTNVETIGNRAFYDCNSLTEILVANGNESFSSKDGVLYNSDFTKIICYPAGKSGENYTVDDSVTVIGDAAFYNCRALTKIILPDKLTAIEDYAFYYCSSIQTIMIPSTVQSVGQASFYGCTKMTDIYIPKSITVIPVGAFSQCIALSDVYYSGSESEWNAIEIDKTMEMNSYLTKANIHYNSEGIVKQIQGDVNEDGVFSVADVILFQKWLLAVPDANLANWKAADLCEDNRLDVFDLCLMKKMLLNNLTSVDE
jgi:hypothetical protein